MWLLSMDKPFGVKDTKVYSIHPQNILAKLNINFSLGFGELNEVCIEPIVYAITFGSVY